MPKFLGPGLNLHHSSYPRHSSDITGSLTSRPLGNSYPSTLKAGNPGAPADCFEKSKNVGEVHIPAKGAEERGRLESVDRYTSLVSLWCLLSGHHLKAGAFCQD